MWLIRHIDSGKYSSKTEVMQYTFNTSTWEGKGDTDRQVSVNLRTPTWPTERAPEQPRLKREALSQKKP